MITVGDLFRPFGWLRLSAIGVMFVIAAVLGVSMGRGVMQSGQSSGSDMYGEYYQALSQSSLADQWESLIETENEEL